MTIKAFDIARRIARDWPQHRNGQASAAIAYYAIFALAPMLVFATSIATRFLSQDDARELAEEHLARTLGPGAANLANTVFNSAKFTSHGLLPNVLSTIMLLYGASLVFVQMRTSLNAIFAYTTDTPREALLSVLFGKLRSIGFVFFGGFVLLASLLGSVVLHATTDRISAATGVPAGVWELLSITLSFTLVAGVLMAAYVWLPSKRPPWRFLLIGALSSAALFELGKWAFSSFVTGGVIASAYGPSGALVAFLVWVYYSAHIILLGAELSHALSAESSAPPASNDVAAD